MNILRKTNILKAIRMGSCGELVIVLMILLAISTVGVAAQNTNQNPKAKRDCDCLQILLTANSNRLEKRNPIPLRVRVENLCDRTVKLLEPSFTIDKSIIIGKGRFGDSRVGRIIRTKTSELDNTAKTVEPGQYLEFVLDTNQLRWMDSMQSNEVFEDLFSDHDLKTGSYHLYSTVVVIPTSKQRCVEKAGKLVRILSNKIEVLFEKEGD